MATNSKQGLPEGTKWKVNMEKNGKTMYMMVYGPRKDQAIASVEDDVKGTGWTVTGAEKAD